MSTRKRKMISKARKLVYFERNYSFRQIMKNYRFWKCVMRFKNINERNKIINRFLLNEAKLQKLQVVQVLPTD